MAIVPSISFAMTDAEFLLLNGVAAPTIPTASPLNGSGASATSSAGTTTVTLAAGLRTDNNIRQLAQRIRRIAQTLNIAYTA